MKKHVHLEKYPAIYIESIFQEISIIAAQT